MKTGRICAILMIGMLLFSLIGCAEQPSATESETYQDLFTYTIAEDSVTVVEETSIAKKPSVPTLTLPEKIQGHPVEVIGENAFYQYKEMRSITLPQSLREIQGGAFYRCYSLEKITIPKNVETIESEAFFRCSALTDITVEEGNPRYCDVNGVLFNKDKTVLHNYPEGKTDKRYTLPDSVTEIGASAFGYQCAALEEIVIPKSVTVFPDYNIFVFPDRITLLVQANSAAERYAKTHELNYKIIN